VAWLRNGEEREGQEDRVGIIWGRDNNDKGVELVRNSQIHHCSVYYYRGNNA